MSAHRLRPNFRTVQLDRDNESAIRQTAVLLLEGFRGPSPLAWPNLDAALAEVRESFEAGRLSRIAVDADGRVLGWIGGIPQYEGHVWEIHPLVVAADLRRHGIGRALVEDMERLAGDRGGLTLWAGSDDENNSTSLSAVNLYEDLPGRIAGIQNLGGHAYEFYQRLGFKIGRASCRERVYVLV